MWMLSLYEVNDGFKLLMDFVCLWHPHLSGKYIDFHASIHGICLVSGEHVHELYHHIKMLSNEIHIAQNDMGADLDLLE